MSDEEKTYPLEVTKVELERLAQLAHGVMPGTEIDRCLHDKVKTVLNEHSVSQRDQELELPWTPSLLAGPQGKYVVCALNHKVDVKYHLTYPVTERQARLIAAAPKLAEVLDGVEQDGLVSWSGEDITGILEEAGWYE